MNARQLKQLVNDNPDMAIWQAIGALLERLEKAEKKPKKEGK